MKKRFTIMLDEKTIKQLKIAASYMTPKQWRESLESTLLDHVFWTIQFYANKGEDIGTATVREMREQNGDK